MTSDHANSGNDDDLHPISWKGWRAPKNTATASMRGLNIHLIKNFTWEGPTGATLVWKQPNTQWVLY